MAWYDPNVADWIYWVLKVIASVNQGHFESGVWRHKHACEAHAAAVLKAGSGLPESSELSGGTQ